MHFAETLGDVRLPATLDGAGYVGPLGQLRSRGRGVARPLQPGVVLPAQPPGDNHTVASINLAFHDVILYVMESFDLIGSGSGECYRRRDLV